MSMTKAIWRRPLFPMSHQSLMLDEEGDYEMGPGAVHRSTEIYRGVEENPREHRLGDYLKAM